MNATNNGFDAQPRDDGGPAFPEVVTEMCGSRGDYWPETHSIGGMSLRDYFAIRALPVVHAENKDEPRRNVCREKDYQAREAYEWADAMLKARQS